MYVSKGVSDIKVIHSLRNLLQCFKQVLWICWLGNRQNAEVSCGIELKHLCYIWKTNVELVVIYLRFYICFNFYILFHLCLHYTKGLHCIFATLYLMSETKFRFETSDCGVNFKRRACEKMCVMYIIQSRSDIASNFLIMINWTLIFNRMKRTPKT